MPEASLYAILARSARTAVIFRRGPSKRVLVLSWNLETDEIVEGRWFAGRIYERRCDLSPDGRYMLYFAATYRDPYFSWTALSQPPQLTALALWPKGDGWGGGGLIKDARRLPTRRRWSNLTTGDSRSTSQIPDGRNVTRGADASRAFRIGSD